MMLAKADLLLHDDISQGVAQGVVFTIKLERSSALGRACQLHTVLVSSARRNIQGPTYDSNPVAVHGGIDLIAVLRWRVDDLGRNLVCGGGGGHFAWIFVDSLLFNLL